VVVTLKEEALGIVLLEDGEEIDAVKTVAPTDIFDRSREIGGTTGLIPGKEHLLFDEAAEAFAGRRRGSNDPRIVAMEAARYARCGIRSTC
jgi:hypothetical protein